MVRSMLETTMNVLQSLGNVLRFLAEESQKIILHKQNSVPTNITNTFLISTPVSAEQ